MTTRTRAKCFSRVDTWKGANPLEQALVREMREELRIRVDEATPPSVRYYTSSNEEKQRIHYFYVKDWTGEILSNEPEKVYWESHVENLSDAIERKVVSKLLSLR